jgi:hypothetical protein
LFGWGELQKGGLKRSFSIIELTEQKFVTETVAKYWLVPDDSIRIAVQHFTATSIARLCKIAELQILESGVFTGIFTAYPQARQTCYNLLERFWGYRCIIHSSLTNYWYQH